MSADKLTRKEMRSPDAFQRVSTQYWKKLVEHRKVAVGIGGALLAVALIAGIISSAGGRKQAGAGAALSQALEATRQGVQGSYDPSADPDLPKFASLKEKNEEIVKRLEEVRAKHAGSAAAQSATLFLADAQFHLGSLDDAEKNYQAFLATSSARDALRPLAYESLGYLYEARQQWDKALESFDQMASAAGAESLKGQAQYHRARVLELSGKKAEAAAAFQKVKDDFKDAPASQLARDRLALLASQGVAAPAAPAKAAEAK